MSLSNVERKLEYGVLPTAGRSINPAKKSAIRDSERLERDALRSILLFVGFQI